MSDTVVCLDFDGTLVNSQGRIHPADVQILASESSVMFVPATGRLIPSVRRTLEQHGLFTGQPIPFPMVLQNGAAVYGPKEVLYAHQTLPPDVQEQVINRLVSHPEIASLYFGLDEAFLLWPNPMAEVMVRRFDLDPQLFVPACRQQAFTKLMGICAEPEPLQQLAAELAHLSLEIAFSLPEVLEINQPGVNKGQGVMTLLDKMGLAEAKVIAAGDGENDLSLFEQAALVFAPSSSPATIRARADYVVDLRQAGLLAPILDVVRNEVPGE